MSECVFKKKLYKIFEVYKLLHITVCILIQNSKDISNSGSTISTESIDVIQQRANCGFNIQFVQVIVIPFRKNMIYIGFIYILKNKINEFTLKYEWIKLVFQM